MSPVGLRFEWRSLHDAGQAGATADLAVVTFMGSCVGMGFAEPFRDGALGWTHMTDGAILPFVDVDCDHIRGFLQGQFLRLGLNDGEEVIGRAIGRVLAHELYHVFAGTTHHSAEGVDQPRYSVRDLVDDRFRIGQEEFHILRTGNAPASPEKGRSRAGAAGSPEAGRSIFVGSGCSACHGARGEGTRHGPVLRLAGRVFNSVTLAAKLGKDGKKMCQRARDLKVPPPSLAESDIRTLLAYLNTGAL